jgi:hypothetical protein
LFRKNTYFVLLIKLNIMGRQREREKERERKRARERERDSDEFGFSGHWSA